MQLASTLLGVMTACATLGSLEMDSHALVSSKHWFVDASCGIEVSTAYVCSDLKTMGSTVAVLHYVFVVLLVKIVTILLQILMSVTKERMNVT